MRSSRGRKPTATAKSGLPDARRQYDKRQAAALMEAGSMMAPQIPGPFGISERQVGNALRPMPVTD
jgi:hypothetical protein